MERTKLLFVEVPTFTADGTYRAETITLEQARTLLRGRLVLSNIANDKLAELTSKAIGQEVPVNRSKYIQDTDMLMLSYSPVAGNFKLLTRIM